VDVIRRSVVVRGRVQGVGFRWAAADVAARFGVTGYIRNAADGSVEAEVEGPAEVVDAMVAWLRQGPSSADVSALETADVAPQQSSRFDILG
jgi:acylphosphatase